MSYLKTIILTLATMILLLLGWIFFSFDSDYEWQIAKEAFLRSDYAAARSALQKLQSPNSVDSILLHQAYLALAQGDVPQYQLLVAQVSKQIESSTDAALMLQWNLNRALCAWIARDAAALQEPLQALLEGDPNNGYVQFLLAGEAYLEHDYRKAQQIWNKTLSYTSPSDWMKRAFAPFFSEQEQKTYLIGCNIELGHITQAKQQIQQLHHIATSQQQEQLDFLMGLSYLKEIENKPIGVVLPYYQMAQSYFEKVPIGNTTFHAERARLLTAIEKLAQEALQQKLYSPLTVFLHDLEKYHATDSISSICHCLIEQLQKEMQHEYWSEAKKIYHTLRQTFIEPNMRRQLGLALDQLAWQWATEEKIALLQQGWDIFVSFSLYPEQLTAAVTAQTEQAILNCITTDNAEITATRSYLNFWDHLKPENKERELFAKKLIAVAIERWRERPQEADKAFKILMQAADIPAFSDRSATRQYIAENIALLREWLSTHAVTTENSQCLKEAGDYFHVETNMLQVSILKSMQQYAMRNLAEKNYLLSEKEAEWVLLLTPDNIVARSLAGRAAYHQHKYRHALQLLAEVQPQDFAVQEAVGVCHIATGQIQKGKQQLEQLARCHALSDETHRLLGYLYYADSAQASLQEWLKVERKDNETYAHLCFLSYQQKDWQQAITFFNALTPPYTYLNELQQIAFNSLNQMQQTESIKKLQQSFQTLPLAVDYLFPAAFIQCKKQHWHISMQKIK